MKDEILEKLKILLNAKQDKLDGLKAYWQNSRTEPGVASQKVMEFVRGEAEGILSAMRLINTL